MADWGWRIFLFKEFVQGRSETRKVHAKTRQVHANVKTKKGESLKRPQLHLIAYLEAQNWTRWQVWSGASFCSRGLFRDGPKHKSSARSIRSIRSLKFTYSSRSLTFALILSFCSLPGRCFCHKSSSSLKVARSPSAAARRSADAVIREVEGGRMKLFTTPATSAPEPISSSMIATEVLLELLR